MMMRYPSGSLGFNNSYDSFLEEEKELKQPLIFLNVSNRIYEDPEVNLDDLRGNE